MILYTYIPVTSKKPRSPMIWACLRNYKFHFTLQTKTKGPYWLNNCLVLILIRVLVFLTLFLNDSEKSHEPRIQKSVLTPKLGTTEICLLILYNRLQKWCKPIKANSSFPSHFINDFSNKFHIRFFKNTTFHVLVWTMKTTYFQFNILSVLLSAPLQ